MKSNKVILANLVVAASLFASMPVIANKDHTDTTTFNSNTKTHGETVNISSIKSKFAADPLVGPLKIEVTLKENTVFLKGQLDTEMQYDRAVALASSFHGVDDVDAGDLKVKNSAHPMDDLFITAKAKGALLKEALVNGADSETWPFKIETKNGIVYIKGEASNEKVKHNAIKTLQSIKGVKSVKDAITIKSSNTTKTQND